MNESITKENLDTYLELDDKIKSRVHKVLYNKILIEHGQGLQGEINNIQFEDKQVHVAIIIHSSCSCCRDENRYYSFPIGYLFSDQWVDTLRADVQRKAEEAERKVKEEKERKRLEQEDRDRQELRRLHKKYGLKDSF